MGDTEFEPWLAHWRLHPDGPAIASRHARLLPVQGPDGPAMLKLVRHPEERGGGAVMEWWMGVGAARILAREGDALLLERACGTRSLSAMARGGKDDEACRILCAVAARLHVPRAAPPPPLVGLARWFEPLLHAAAAHGGVLARSAEAARALLAEPREQVVLHGDLHHDNVLDFGPRGWLAIDPKGLLGERGFDLANIFTNPDLEDPTRPVGTDPRRFARRLEVVAEAAGMERTRLLRWILAWTGLSATWFLADGEAPEIDLRIGALAAAALDR
jgi:streptomycin 6-kinase